MSLFRLSLALLLVTAGCAPAREEARFLAPNAVNYLALIPPPPADNSPAGQADINTILNLQEDRTPAQVKRVERVNTQSPFSFARPVLGEWLRSKDFPKTKAIIDQVTREADETIREAKRHFNRRRPYDRDSRVKLIVGKPGNESYPSGHSACAAVWCVIWSAAFPEHAREFQDQLRETMWARVMAGVHYPTDTESGKTLGLALGEAFLRSSRSKAAIETIRAEIGDRVKTTPPPPAAPL